MKKIAIAIAALAGLIGGPLLAAECSYVSGMDQGSVAFVGQGAVLTDAVGDAVDCEVMWGDEGGNLMTCEGSPGDNFSLASSTLGGADGKELLVLWDHVWYRQCS